MASSNGSSRSKGGGRILLLIENAANRERLAASLRQYTTLKPHGTSWCGLAFDVVIADLAGLRTWQQVLREAKQCEQPVFLPVMLIVAQAKQMRSLRAYWDLVDEFLVAPVDPVEFIQRTDMLLRARRQAQAQREHLAYLVHHDQVTGLPNRTLFRDRLQQAIHDAVAQAQHVQVAVVHISLAPILKVLGASGMERAAVACSEHLRSVFGEEVVLARLTTEEWAVMLRGSASPDESLTLWRQLQMLSATPITIGEERVHVSPRIGIAAFPGDAAEPDALLDRALAALANAERKAVPAFYSETAQQRALRQLRTEARLHDAVHSEQFEFWLQPKLRLADRALIGAEALIRWRNPTDGWFPPGEFIPVAESCGLIPYIDRWMLQEACAFLRRWRAEARATLRIAVNVSGRHIEEAGFVDGVSETLRRNDVEPEALELELTETAMTELGEDNLAKLRDIRDRGIGIALDDFGTGYCSLSYLHKLPISTLKIDKSFIDDIDRSRVNAAITQTIVALADNFGLETVAEGVESEAQAAYLRELGVEIGQGYLFAKPMPAQDLLRWAATRTD